MSITSESAFEESIEAHLVTHGWRTGSSLDYSVSLGLIEADLIGFIQESQPGRWKDLVKRLGGERAAYEKVSKRIADEIDKRGTVDVLRGETKLNGVGFRVAYFAPANHLVPKLWEQYDANRLTVVRQLHHSESNPKSSLDLALFVNGIPVATAELKNPLTHQSVEHAMTQYRKDRKPGDLIFRARTLVHFAVDPHQVYMSTRLAGESTRFLPFNQGSGGPGCKGGAGNPSSTTGYGTAYLWEQVLQRDAWLGLLGEFIHIEKVTDELGKPTGDTVTLFPRYHQWHAVQRLLAVTREAGPGVNRLIEHSAGSGKSNTIAWLAHHLSRLHTGATDAELSDEIRKAGLGPNQPIFSKVIIITDRRVLDRQLQETVAGFSHTPGTIVKIDEDSKQLREALGGNAARVIITTLQKFPVVVQQLKDKGGDGLAIVDGDRFAIIVDEAHSSTSGDAMKDLKSALGGSLDSTDVDSDADPLTVAEQAEAKIEAEAQDATDLIAASMTARGMHGGLSFFAFTATPKPKTLNLFGEAQTQPDGSVKDVAFHLYSMRQAIEEEFIRDVLDNYTTYDTFYRLSNTPPDDPEVQTSKAAAAIARFVSLHPTNLSQKAEVIVEHFRQKTAHKLGGHAKAMIVTRSRLHAVRYKQAIDAYIAQMGYTDLHSLVAFSGKVTDDSDATVTYTEALMNGFGEGQLPQRFASDDYQVLIVAEKYQTGFDQPLLHTMYVDKKLAGVKAVQTLSRLNRTMPGKSDTFVLDFANTAKEIQGAFEPFYEATLAEQTDPNLLYTLQHTIEGAHVIHPEEQAAAVDALLHGQTRKQSTIYANLGTAVGRFVELDQDDQDGFRKALRSFVRAYAFLAQVMPWTDASLESLYLYGQLLLTELPSAQDEPLPQISESVLLTHLRTEARAEEEKLTLTGTDEAGEALPGGGMGAAFESPTSLLSQLIDTLNERYGMSLGPVDMIWVDQQRAALLEDDRARVVALNNDRSGYEIVLEQFTDRVVLDRADANGVLVDAYFEQPGVKDRLLRYLATTYDEFRSGPA